MKNIGKFYVFCLIILGTCGQVLHSMEDAARASEDAARALVLKSEHESEAEKAYRTFCDESNKSMSWCSFASKIIFHLKQTKDQEYSGVIEALQDIKGYSAAGSRFPRINAAQLAARILFKMQPIKNKLPVNIQDIIDEIGEVKLVRLIHWRLQLRDQLQMPSNVPSSSDEC